MAADVDCHNRRAAMYTVIILIVNEVVLVNWVGNVYVTNGRQIKRPAAWHAFIIIVSVTNLSIGFLLAIIRREHAILCVAYTLYRHACTTDGVLYVTLCLQRRLIMLLTSAILALGMMDRSLLAVFSSWDFAYTSFLAGVHLQVRFSLAYKQRSR
jgi:hypothetical protein